MYFFSLYQMSKETQHLRIPPQHPWSLPRKVTHENKHSFMMQGLVAEWLRPLQVQIARNDYSKWSLEMIRHLLLSEVGSKPARVTFFIPSPTKNPDMNWSMFFFVARDVKTNSTSTVLHLRTPQHLRLLPRKVSHENKRSSTMQGPVAEWLRPQIRIAWNVRLFLSEAGVFELLFHPVFDQEPQHKLVNVFFSLY